MKRKVLLAAASAIPLLLTGLAARAVDTISTSTSTPVATATATNNAPDDVDVASGGSIAATASGAAVTLNSNNKVTNEGSIGFTGVDNATGILIQGGFTGSVKSSGSITVTDNYTPTSDPNTGLQELPYAKGVNRAGILVTGPGVFTGSITNSGTITVHGANSFGVNIAAAITGDYQSLVVTPATSTAAETLAYGSINVLGGEPASGSTAATPPVVGFNVAATGSVGGNITLSGVSATGYQAQAVSINGAVAGALNIGGFVTSTGYRSTTRSTYPTIGAKYTAQELEQGGSAVSIGASIGGGVVISAPPLDAITNASTSNDLINGQSVLQTLQGSGSISVYGSAPALAVGSAARSLTIGVVGANNTVFGEAGSGAYGLVNQGSITANGVYDTVNYPNLPAPVAATAVQVGGYAGFNATIQGGVYNTGVIQAQAYQASATAIHFMTGGATPLLLNDGVITASVLQESAATSGIPRPGIYGILIDQGATVNAVVNNSAITANITGTGGVGGVIGAIVDKSGTLATVLNTGSISAQANQTLITAPMPVVATAIDLSAGTTAQTILQARTTNTKITGAAAYSGTTSYSQGKIVNFNGIVYQATSAAAATVDPINYPSYWREIGALNPYINGSILFGSGGGNLTVTSGLVEGAIINLGVGSNNNITVNGVAGASPSATMVFGSIEEVSSATAAAQVASNGGVASLGGGDGTLTININNGTLNDLNPNTEYVKSVNVGSNGVLLVAADPTHGTNTKFITSGASTFGQGAEVGISLLSVPQQLQSTFTILQTGPGGTLTAGTFTSGVINQAPWLYSATAAYVAPADANSPAEIQVTVTEKTPAQIGFNAAEAAALQSVLAAAPANASIQNALLAQTTQAGLKSVYDQLLPSQGQGLFEALDAAARSVGGMTGTAPEGSSRVAGTSLWLQEVNERVDRTSAQTIGSYSKLFGVIAGYERSGAGGGALGLTLAYFNANELDDADHIGTGVVSSMLEAGVYYRRSLGHLTVSGRAGIGYGWFADHRVFASTGTNLATNANSATGVEFSAHSNWGALFYDGHFEATYEQKLGRFYARPEVSADYLELDEGSHSDTGGGAGFDLTVAARSSNRLSGQAVLVLGREWGQAAWLRTEIRGGYREIFSGQVGDTTANFTGGGLFTLLSDDLKGGWYTAGFSIKGGSQYSYLALEGDLDFRPGQHRYDLRIAGRSMF